MELHRAKPVYQQNDYIGWITSATRQETGQKRLSQMLEELESGDKYMKLDHRRKEPTK
jgi:hypothetical protein